MEDCREERLFFNKITWFSFVFSLLVIWIHSYNAELFLGKTEAMARIYRIEHWIGDGIGQVAVPGFFMISACLFYRDFSWDKLRGKWNRRIRSVMVPYILWNFLYYIGYVTGSRLPWMTQVVGKGVIPFGLAEGVDAVINYTYNYVFWYLRQLIFLILLAPVLYPVLKRLWSRVIFFVLLWIVIAKDLRLPLVNADALFYYSSSASLALSRETVKRTAEKIRAAAGRYADVIFSDKSVIPGVLGWMKFGCGAAVICSAAWFYYIGLSRGMAEGLVLCRLLAVAGFWVAVPAGELPVAGEAVKHNFFLYATHFAFVRFFNKAGAKLLPPHPAVPLILYLIMPALVHGITFVLGACIRRSAPSVWNVLNGGR